MLMKSINTANIASASALMSFENNPNQITIPTSVKLQIERRLLVASCE